MRKKITIPAAGQAEIFPFTGRSILIEQMNIYPGADQVPVFKFGNGSGPYGMYPRSTYPNDQGEFNSLEIIGTAESAGDEIWIQSTDECLPFEINVNFTETGLATVGDTAIKTASNAVQGFSDVEIQDADGNLPTKMYIFVTGGATRGINYAFGSNPVQGDENNQSLYWNNKAETTPNRERKDEPLEIVGLNFIQKFKFIATINGETPNLVYTLEY